MIDCAFYAHVWREHGYARIVESANALADRLAAVSITKQPVLSSHGWRHER